MVFTASKLLALIAVICAVVAVIAVLFGIDNADVWPAAMALSLAFGWSSLLVP